MVVFFIPHRARIASCLSLAAATVMVFFLGWKHAPWIAAVAAATAVWICIEGQKVEIDGSRVTLTRTLLGRTFGKPQAIDMSKGTRAVLSVLLPRRGAPMAIRRVVFLGDGQVIARTKDLPLDIEVHLLSSLREEANIEVSTIESGGSFRPKVL